MNMGITDLICPTWLQYREMKSERNEVSFGITYDERAATNLTLYSEVENRLIETYMKHQQHIEPNGKQRIEATCYMGTLNMHKS